MYIHTMNLYVLVVLCIFNILYYVYYTCMSPRIQDGIITTLNTRVSILAAANPLQVIETSLYVVAMTTTENTSKLFLSIL